ncbi:hypothetical protein niasHT_037928 [Heterodera trifolii]|uniref:Uncharacterized protein n=1 Tax=Heterodera trifolii TaxID=157864 RepID=A0ABD2I495_9BILA
MLIDSGTVPNAAPKMILIVGGSTEPQERGALNTCELFSIPDLCPQSNSSPMNSARRAPALFQFQKNVFVVGGCSGPGQHLANAESVQFDGKNLTEWKTYEFEVPNAFSCASFCQFLGGTAFAFGGFDGVQCSRQSLRIRPLPQSFPPPYPTVFQPESPLPYALKNGIAIAVTEGQRHEEERQRRIWLVGGWDGHRTLKTLFEYSLPGGDCSLIGLLPYPIEGHSVAKSSLVAPQKAFISGGFDGIGLRSDFLTIDLQSGTVQHLAGVGLRTARENHCSVIFGDGQGNEWLAIIGGWDGHKALSDWELFELLPTAPWLRKTDKGPWGEKPPELGTKRNRAAALLIC